MNKGRLIQLSAVVFASTLAVMPVSASILNGPARFLNNEIKKAEKRNKFCSAPIHKNLPILSQLHKGVSHLVGLKSLYKTVTNLPDTVADNITDNSFINGFIRLVIQTPLEEYVTCYFDGQKIMRAGVEAVVDKTIKATETTVKAHNKQDQQVRPKIVKDIIALNKKLKGIPANVAMGVAMGNRPSIAGLVYDHVIKAGIKHYAGTVEFVGTLNDLRKSKLGEVKIYNAYAKALFCKICQPVEDKLYEYLRQKIEQYAQEN